MTTSDKKKLTLLILLVVLGGLSWYFVFRPTMMSASSTPTTPAARKPQKPIKVDQDAKIRLDLLDQHGGNDVGRRNLFQFPPKVVPKPVTIASSTNTLSPSIEPQRPTPPTLVTPSIPPFRPFKYEGVSVIKNSGRIIGAVSESGNTYQVREGDYLLGTYHITRLTEALVEIEDTQYKRRQTFPRVAVQ